MKPVRGLTLGDRYRLVRRIAVGGMGEVWVAADDALGREVAVKVLRAEYAGNEDFLNRLRTEARNSAALSHPNIAQMYDYGERQGSGYLVMELVLGEPMADLLEREPVLPPARLLPLLSQTARGLHAAHVAGVVHRDIKPGNILIDRSGTVKITDFGVSLAANQVPMTATGMVMGTAQYLSPEQAVGQAATGASDVYALGIVAYESVVGHRPFTGSTPVDIAVAHVNEQVPALPSSVDHELAELIMAMLEKDPTKRPRTAAALAQVLDTIAERLTSDPWSATVAVGGRRARRARTESSPPPPPAPPGPAGAAGPAGLHARPGPADDVAPVITPIVIPTTVRATPEQEDEDETSAPPSPHETTHGPALPWERPTPGERHGDDESGSAAGPRSYPPRREMHGPSRTRRPAPARSAPRGAGPASGARGERGPTTAPAVPKTRAERRRAEAGSGRARQDGGRTSTTTGRRLGGLGGLPRGLTWPLVALLGLLVVLVVATLTARGGSDSALSAAPDASYGAGIVTTSLPAWAGDAHADGMISPDVPRADARAVPTIPKDE
ncbi:serine/threonine-protein kinase [Cellulosimicrobium arenosum]|uniref:non-specific serine/threonine protein kinase n=1 Tax=Cellulosimicrobium arenosum TaxID=2708133 RepID=A0A927J175_9MICO|nr:serine/threonine-protein kinase [Cellulosimicrobium arenosum]MBD8080003.1 protein kinase [Cellulosimicrobium arenosum]